MTALRNILVPIDGSAPAMAALEHAVALASEGGGAVDVIYVEAPDSVEVATRTPPPGERHAIEARMKEGVDRGRNELGDRVRFDTLVGDPLAQIIQTAADGDYDLVVLGTHGRIGRLHTMLGSVAEGVVRTAPCPVLTVREPGDAYQGFADRRHHRPSVGGRAPHHPT
jgi:nucleotide-binding universal stress UspA family protein